MNKEIKITFSSKFFETFDGSQEDLDDLISNIKREVQQLDQLGQLPEGEDFLILGAGEDAFDDLDDPLERVLH